MNRSTHSEPKSVSQSSQGLLQRKCACGQHILTGGTCTQCRSTSKSPQPLQAKLRVGGANDRYEQEADRVADQVMTMSERPAVSAAAPRVQRLARQPAAPSDAAPGSVDRVLASSGMGLESSLRHDMEQRFGHDFSAVQVHTGAAAAQSARDISAHAYTVGHNIVFGAGKFAPKAKEGRRLLAHELTHVVQQGKGSSIVRRAVELRPPGAGEASAFDRVDELVNRLTTTSAAVSYSLAADGRTLQYEILPGVAPDAFDRMMTGFIDAAQVIPLRLITSAGRVLGAAGTFVPLTGDSFITGYVDLDDLLSSSDIGFKLLLGHFITERLQVRNYARRIGTPGLAPLFNSAHDRGREAEAVLLQDLLNDPSVRFHYDELKPNGTTFVRAFRSRDEGYRVFWIIRGHGIRRTISISDIRVVAGTRRLSIEDFIAERASASATP